MRSQITTNILLMLILFFLVALCSINIIGFNDIISKPASVTEINHIIEDQNNQYDVAVYSDKVSLTELPHN